MSETIQTDEQRERLYALYVEVIDRGLPAFAHVQNLVAKHALDFGAEFDDSQYALGFMMLAAAWAKHAEMPPAGFVGMCELLYKMAPRLGGDATPQQPEPAA